MLFRQLLLSALLLQLRTYLDRQSEQVDEARTVLLIVNIVLVKGRYFLIVQRVRRGNARIDDVALVEL